MARFFWSPIAGTRGKQWVSWENLCYPKSEGGLGLRSLQDLSEALFAKLWWKFRVSTDSLWSIYMWNKYCKKVHPVIANHLWRMMIQRREEVEHYIWWQIKGGDSSFWFDNWTGEGALYHIEGGPTRGEEELEVQQFCTETGWNRQKLAEVISEDMVLHILENCMPCNSQSVSDKPWWKLEKNGEFSVKSAWQEIRDKREIRRDFSFIWNKRLPFKISFFIWRAWKRRIPTDDNLKRMKISIVSKCWCCKNGEMETMTHLFLTAPVAFKLWRHFAMCAGIQIEGLSLQQVIIKWWTAQANDKLRTVHNAIPSMVMWIIWKERNKGRHGEGSTFQNMHFQVLTLITNLIRTNYPWLRNIPNKWHELVLWLGGYKPKIYMAAVKWKFPSHLKIKCNTDGACRGNPGISAYGFCFRNWEGDLIYAKGEGIGIRTNLEAEVSALVHALRFAIGSGLDDVTYETDSLALFKWISGEWKIPWELIRDIEVCIEFLKTSQSSISHTFREGNQLADHIANEALDREITMEAHNFHQLSSKGKTILNWDKTQFPSLRIKTKPIMQRQHIHNFIA